jgi:polysaccharide biosynthesis/export protein
MKVFVASILASLSVAAFAQNAPKVTVENASPQKSSRAEYVLGPGDQVRIHVVNLDELPADPIAIDLDGTVSLPYVGRVKIAGLTAPQAETKLSDLYKRYLLQPDISITVVAFQSQPVSVLGAVKNPGVQQVQGNRTLVEMLSSAGGLAENAGSRLKIARDMKWGPLPLPTAKTDSSGKFSVAEVNLKSLFEAENPQENIVVKPDDVISVPVADTVYVIGHVNKAGPYAFDDHAKMTVLQAVSMAGGMDNLAQPKNARILRKVPGQAERTELAVNLKAVMDGAPDVPMQPEDILFIPNNAPKNVMLRTLDTAVQMGTGVVIWGRY